jgi:hypothetical protein
VIAQNRHFSGSRRQQAFENFDGCSLPRPIRPEQTEAFAALDLEVQAAHSFHLAVIRLAQVAALNSGGHGVILPDAVGLRRAGIPVAEVGGLFPLTDWWNIFGVGGGVYGKDAVFEITF